MFLLQFFYLSQNIKLWKEIVIKYHERITKRSWRAQSKSIVVIVAVRVIQIPVVEVPTVQIAHIEVSIVRISINATGSQPARPNQRNKNKLSLKILLNALFY